jgi:hypothetical protein
LDERIRSAAWLTIAALAACGLSCSAFAPETGAPALACTDADSDPATPVDFHRDIRPMIDRFRTDPIGPGCRSCHYASEDSHEGLDLGRLNLETLGTLRQGGITSGAGIVVAGKPCSSAIVQKLIGTYKIGPRMPKNATRFWSPQEIQVVVDWIAEGAKGGDAE